MWTLDCSSRRSRATGKPGRLRRVETLWIIPFKKIAEAIYEALPQTPLLFLSQKEAKNQNFNETACKNSKNISILCSRDIFEEIENLKTNLPFIALFELIIFLDRFFENFAG